MQYQYKKIIFTILAITSIIGYGYFVYAAAPLGGYTPGATLNPDCAPGDTDCIVALSGGGSGWLLTGNAGTDGGTTNFIGTTDAQDLVLKTNSNTVARFGQNAEVELGSDYLGFLLKSISTNVAAMSWGWGGNASGEVSTVFGMNNIADGDLSTVFGESNEATGNKSTAFGYENHVDGYMGTVFGRRNYSTGDLATAFGRENFARSYAETTFGYFGSDYTALDTASMNSFDRLFSIGNGNGSGHNAYTLWKDGSFAYNDDNFQNDIPGTEQNMFYFNYGNHDGLGTAQTKRAIRLGSVSNNEADINSLNVGDKSVAIGFAFSTFGVDGPIASGFGSTAFGAGSVASNTNTTAFNLGQATGVNAIAFGGVASGQYAFTFGYRNNTAPYSDTQAIGTSSYAFGGSSQARGDESVTLGTDLEAYSFNEIVLGRENTSYIPSNTATFSTHDGDRLFTLANGGGFGTPSDALTILKNGQTGIAIDNFETNTNGNIFQVGDGNTGIIGYVDNGTGNWVAVSDERKKDNITDLSYGLDQVLQLRPTSFNYKRNNEHTIGFIAQQVLPIIPEAVYGTESEGYGMSYATLTPVLVKAIQEMNLNITMLSDTARPNTWREALIAWFESTTNGIRSLVVKDKICVDNECLTKDDIHALLQLKNQTIPPAINIYPVGPNNPPVTTRLWNSTTR